MKRIIVLLLIIILTRNIHAQMMINGLLDSTVSATVNDGEFSYGIEEYANLRFQSRLFDSKAVVYGAVNLIAAAGDYRMEMVMSDSSGVVTGDNYAACIELERLYFRLNFDKAYFDGGLFRLPFGYGQVWSPSDFLNPKNPLKPDARPRGVLGAAVGFFPAGDLKLSGFAVAKKAPVYSGYNGFRTGLSAENHFSKVSVQGLYAYELSDLLYWTGEQYKEYQIHRAGLSVKADLGVSLTLDTLYSYTYEKRYGKTSKMGIDGLSLSAGADYSFIDGRLIVLAEYLYNGETSSTAFNIDNLFGMPYRHYVYSGFTWLFSDFTNITAALISCLDETSFIPLITFNHDLFQGAVLTITTQADFDTEIYMLSARLRLRF